ncbi:MAG TPA: hypothetical protein VK076_05685 [Candidatus Sphingobacterium stercoripullorum]|uniref:Uncharacterized protein n=1 Tax=Candidatus Sphingobacterium stercoripullorum TaxID=2838759 RepID=A0A9D1W9E5_9SPHI|nr:hypothetical protein [Candidatus Sphingobacterium stercoripullorum]HLR50043.1 hypothetical protein [Candidatus Sphingobacterium stercoripullorum]
MKKVFLSIITAAALTLGIQESKAQTPYKTALGLGIDLGDGATLFGPQIKHAFSAHNAGQAQVLFGDHITTIGADYSYNKPFQGANGLNWYVGVGPQLTFFDSKHVDTQFALRPAAGLEFVIPQSPIGIHFDWKPWWTLSGSSHFEAGRFSLGFKYILK